MENEKLRKTRLLAEFSVKLSKSNPSYSRYTMYRSKDIIEEADMKVQPHCPICCSQFSTDNYKVRLAPRMQLTTRLNKWLEIFAAATKTKANTSSMSCVSHTLTKYQRKMVKRYLNSSNVLVISCKVCGKSSKVKAQDRTNRVKQLLSWKPKPEKVETPPVGKKKKSKKMKSASILEVSPFPEVSRLPSVGSPLVTSTPLPQHDSGLGDCSSMSTGSQSVKSLKKTKPKSDEESPVFALLGGPQGGGGVKKKRKGKHMHQQLEKLLHQQKVTDSQTKSEKKNSLESFLSELTY